MSHDLLVLVAKIFGPIWMMGFLLIVTLRAYAPILEPVDKPGASA